MFRCSLSEWFEFAFEWCLILPCNKKEIQQRTICMGNKRYQFVMKENRNATPNQEAKQQQRPVVELI